jgi:hypothetical protein
MLGVCTDRSSRLHASIKNLWEVTRHIVLEFQHSTRIETCKKSLGGLALHSLGKNMPRVPKCQFYPSLKMPRVANHLTTTYIYNIAIYYGKKLYIIYNIYSSTCKHPFFIINSTYIYIYLPWIFRLFFFPARGEGEQT